jgi:hypothetical protein
MKKYRQGGDRATGSKREGGGGTVHRHHDDIALGNQIDNTPTAGPFLHRPIGKLSSPEGGCSLAAGSIRYRKGEPCQSFTDKNFALNMCVYIATGVVLSTYTPPPPHALRKKECPFLERGIYSLVRRGPVNVHREWKEGYDTSKEKLISYFKVPVKKCCCRKVKTERGSRGALCTKTVKRALFVLISLI